MLVACIQPEHNGGTSDADECPHRTSPYWRCDDCGRDVRKVIEPGSTKDWGR